MEVVVLNIDVEGGLLPPSTVEMLAVMALITTAMTSPLLRYFGYPSLA